MLVLPSVRRRGGPLSRYLKLRSMVAFVWAITSALYIEAFCFLRWWHPSCNSQVDGTSYYAVGIPLPFAEPTPYTSDYVFLPTIFLADIVVLIAVFLPLFLALFRWLPVRNKKVTYAVAALGCVLLLLEVSRWCLGGGFMFHTTSSLTTSYGDTYLSYRPAIIALHDGNRACNTWWTEHAIFPPLWWW